jgi:hypothetical protein
VVIKIKQRTNNKMERLRTPASDVIPRHQVATERNTLRITDAVPETDAGPDRSQGDMRVGDMNEMAAAEGSDTGARPGNSNSNMAKRDNGEW